MLSGIFIMNYIILLLLPALCATQSLKITPQVEIYNLDVTQTNAGVTFSCGAEDGKTVADANLEWYDENGQRIPRFYEGRGDTMHMYTVEREGTSLQMKIPLPDINNDNGRHTCKGILDGRNVEASITLLLYKGIQLVSPTTQYPLLGHDEKINCTVTASLKPETSWAFHNWKPVTGDRYLTLFDYLIIRNLTEADDGTYFCSVTLSNGDSRDYPIRVIGSKVPVMSAPVTSLEPKPKAGDTAELTCQATGRPAPVYNFYKVEGNNDIPVIPEAVTNGKLTLNITQDTEGQYKCVASNVKGSVSVVFYVDVMIPPHINVIEVVSGSESPEGRLSCSAVGDPQPSVTWKREGQNSYFVEQPTGDGRIYVEIEKTQEGEKNERKRTIATLFFKTLQPDDMSNYVCEASNIVGTDEETAHVEVKYKPNFSSQDQTVFYGWVGGNINLTCKANGNPQPVIRWMYQESELQSTGNYTIQTGVSSSPTQAISYLIPTVKIDNVDSIFGTYICRAENRYGQAEEELQFEKAVLPDAPQLVVVDRKSTMLEVAVKQPARNGGQPVKQYSVKYGPPTASDPEYKTMTVEINAGDPSNTRVKLKNLEAKTEYRIKIAAITNVGTGVAAGIINSTLEVSRSTSASPALDIERIFLVVLTLCSTSWSCLREQEIGSSCHVQAGDKSERTLTCVFQTNLQEKKMNYCVYLFPPNAFPVLIEEGDWTIDRKKPQFFTADGCHHEHLSNNTVVIKIPKQGVNPEAKFVCVIEHRLLEKSKTCQIPKTKAEDFYRQYAPPSLKMSRGFGLDVYASPLHLGTAAMIIGYVLRY